MSLLELLGAYGGPGLVGLASGLGSYLGAAKNNRMVRRAVENAVKPLERRITALERAQGWKPREAQRE